MPELVKIIGDILLDDADVSGLVADRVYTGQLPQNVNLPAISIHMIDEPSHPTLEEGISELAYPRIQISARGIAGADALNVSTAAKAALNGQRGVFEGIRVDGFINENRQGPIYEPETKTYHVPTDFKVWHSE
jgi:hypothetical protein